MGQHTTCRVRGTARGERDDDLDLPARIAIGLRRCSQAQYGQTEGCDGHQASACAAGCMNAQGNSSKNRSVLEALRQ